MACDILVTFYLSLITFLNYNPSCLLLGMCFVGSTELGYLDKRTCNPSGHIPSLVLASWSQWPWGSPLPRRLLQSVYFSLLIKFSVRWVRHLGYLLSCYPPFPFLDSRSVLRCRCWRWDDKDLTVPTGGQITSCKEDGYMVTEPERERVAVCQAGPREHPRFG